MRYMQSKQYRLKGFTLAELLIALAVLGTIATFTIPKVLNSTQTGVNKAIFKETIASVYGVLHEGLLTGEMKNANNGTYVISKLSAIKVCDTNSLIQGCTPASSTGFSYEITEPGLILPNGAMVFGLNNWSPTNSFVIDANGEKPPNTIGEDILDIAYCIDPVNCSVDLDRTIRVGEITYRWTDFTNNTYRDANKALFISLF